MKIGIDVASISPVTSSNKFYFSNMSFSDNLFAVLIYLDLCKLNVSKYNRKQKG